MSVSPSLQCVVVTPEKTLLDERADGVVFPAYDGQIGILRGRAPLVAFLGHGELRLIRGETTRRFYVEGGFVQVRDDVVTILTQTAVPAEELDLGRIEQALEQARLLPIPDRQADAAKFEALARAYAQRRLYRRTRHP